MVNSSVCKTSETCLKATSKQWSKWSHLRSWDCQMFWHFWLSRKLQNNFAASYSYTVDLTSNFMKLKKVLRHGKKVNVAVKRCSCNVWADIVLNYALNKLTLCTKYCKHLHVALHKAEGVNALHVEVIAPYWRHREESFRHNKDEHEGKEWAEQREQFTSSLQKESSSESQKSLQSELAEKLFSLCLLCWKIAGKWIHCYIVLLQARKITETLPIKALYQFIFCPAVRMMCFWPCRFQLLRCEC